MGIPNTPSTTLAQLAPITTTSSGLAGLVLAVPQFLGTNSLGRNKPQYTIGYQPTYPPQPSGAQSTLPIPQPAAFQFHYEGEQSITCQSDITDHYIEDNTAIQDQIAVKPEIIATHGFIGELNDVPPLALRALQTAAMSLTSIGAYVPQISSTALLAYNEAFFAYQLEQQAQAAIVSTWGAINGSGGEAVANSGNGALINYNQASQSLQQKAFQLFYAYWFNRVLFTVQTPWAVFVNCAINTLRPIQDAETNVITDFELSFKVIRTATTNVTTPVVGGRAIAQQSSTTKLGSNTPSPTSVPLLNTGGPNLTGGVNK